MQQVLERLNPLLERVIQHYLDIESSQILDEDSDDGASSRAHSSNSGAPPTLPLQLATAVRQSFIKTLDQCLDTWMSEWIPDAFLHAALANAACGSRAHVESVQAGLLMTQLGVAVIDDPVSSLLLARFAVDFELTLTQSIYQLCEHGISVVPGGADASALSSADVSMSNLLSTARGDAANDPSERLQSMTASATRADSLASVGSYRGPGNRPAAGGGAGLLTLHHSRHAAKWRSIAEQLVRNFVITVGRDISADYLEMCTGDRTVYQTHSAPTAGNGTIKRIQCSVSDAWLSICRWMRQIEDDTNALFYDPVFSATLKSLEAAGQADSGSTMAAANTAASELAARQQANGHNSLSPHAHILSNIDRLFAERVDVFPKAIDPLKSGQIMFHLAMQTIKTALESLRLRAAVINARSEFQQVVVDAAFVRSWMLRYAGVMPGLRAVALDNSQPASVATARGVAHESAGRMSWMPTASGGVPATTGAASAPLPVVNERNAQAIHNLVDDWVNAAKACALDQTMPDSRVVDKAVFEAWMATYFNRNIDS
ncbi:hypothetical protein H4S01_005273 [Coemansia sp. RSA 2610]|nr:hypothetical protein H4S01_005273 [Coemansia sp. RSA 2610]